MFEDLNKLSSELDNTPAKVNKSKLFIKSIGRAAHNIDTDNPKLEIIPIEDLGYVDGEITHDKQKLEVQGNDHTGSQFSVAIETSNTLLATWLPFSTNRLTVPHIRRGERVLIWQYGDVDEYYWTTMGMDDNLRKLETVVYAYSNTKDETDTKLTPDNTYSCEVSTHKGLITLQTSKSNGEPYKYILQINAKEGRVVLTDDNDNFIEIDSTDSSVMLHNSSGSILQVLGSNININCGGTVNISASKVNVKANTSFTGSLTSNSKNISDSHTHTGVSKGPANTGSVS